MRPDPESELIARSHPVEGRRRLPHPPPSPLLAPIIPAKRERHFFGAWALRIALFVAVNAFMPLALIRIYGGWGPGGILADVVKFQMVGSFLVSPALILAIPALCMGNWLSSRERKRDRWYTFVACASILPSLMAIWRLMLIAASV